MRERKKNDGGKEKQKNRSTERKREKGNWPKIQKERKQNQEMTKEHLSEAPYHSISR
jgi:hypothetical protein